MAASPDMAPKPDATTFSHDVTVAAITRYYQVIERLHGPGTIKYPPKGGWPQITPEHAQHFNLGPEAFRLVKELPYCEPHIVPECRPRNYPREFEPPLPPQRYAGDSDGNPDFPPHVFPLAEGGYRWGSTLIIDTKRGVVIWHNMNEDTLAEGCPKPDAASEIDFDPDPEAHEPLGMPRGWRSAPTYRIETFFAMAEEQLKLLHWIPMLTEGDDPLAEPRVYGEPNEDQRERIKILRDSGWPGDDWDYMGAYRATEAWRNERDELEMAQERMRKATLGANL